ncbi:MAG TPA: DegT/DnrJ/EryC1/StrS family aminotransferase [Candidatus Acidoferrales bacterium]|nr:DegT/DnrJ/EryC1/StrS family aminotransferase [Candidatus Acidoferrales bacterium]
MKDIPILDLRSQHQAIRAELLAALESVIDNGQYIIGPNVKAFEDEFARYLGTGHAIGLNSGTDALHLALRALDIGPGDEVITTTFSFIATAEAISIVGATPVFVDIDPRTWQIDAKAIERAITPRTRAIIPVHLYGSPAPMGEIMRIAREHNLEVIEDCAQSVAAAIDGKKTGTFGTISAFSFFPSKNLGACGDGGAIVTDREDLAQRVRALRAHGGRKKYYHEEIGLNSRLDEIQAAVLRVKLRYLDAWTASRRAIAARYNEGFGASGGIERPIEESGCYNVYHQYTIGVAERDALQAHLRDRGIATAVYYPLPLHVQPAYAMLGGKEGDMPFAEAAAKAVLSLPVSPDMPASDQDRVIEAVRELTSILSAA